MQVCVIGLGTIGLATAKHLKHYKHLKVYGYDINREAVSNAIRQGVNATAQWKSMPPCTVYVICVSTSMNHEKPDMTNIYDAATKIIYKTSKTPLISIESTVTLGTSQKIREYTDAHVIHVPHRYWPQNPQQYGVRQLRLIGAVNKTSLKRGLTFYELVEVPLQVVGSSEIAELAKITENAYRYLQVAFAEELALICMERGINFNELREACNTHFNTVKLLEAKAGIGGSCLPKDSHYLASLSKHTRLLQAAFKANKEYVDWVQANANLLPS